MTKPLELPLKAILVDDEKSARDGMRMLLSKHVPDVIVVDEAHSIASALEVISKNQIDLLFLDISMPSGNGFRLLEKLKEISFEVIFVTAHEQHAIRAIRYAALDYLLKPVDPESLKKAVDRATEKLRSEKEDFDLSVLVDYIKNRGYTEHKFLLPNKEGVLVIDMADIIRCEGEGSYTTLHFTNRKKIVETKTLKHFEQLLDPNMFFRTYQSHLINIRHIKGYQSGRGGWVIMSDGQRLPVSRDKKQSLLESMQKHFT